MNSKVTAALKAAKKETSAAKNPDRLVYIPTESMVKLCTEIQDAKTRMDEEKRVYQDKMELLRDTIDPWRQEKCRSGEYANSVDIPYTDDSKIQVQYKNQFSKMDVELEPALKKVLSDNPEEADKKFDTLFRTENTLSISSKITNDEDKLTGLVEKLLKVMTKEEFAMCFEYKQVLVTKPAYDQLQYSTLTKEQAEELTALGVRQTIVPMCR